MKLEEVRLGVEPDDEVAPGGQGLRDVGPRWTHRRRRCDDRDRSAAVPVDVQRLDTAADRQALGRGGRGRAGPRERPARAPQPRGEGRLASTSLPRWLRQPHRVRRAHAVGFRPRDRHLRADARLELGDRQAPVAEPHARIGREVECRLDPLALETVSWLVSAS